MEHTNLSNKQFSSKVCNKRKKKVVSMETICHIFAMFNRQSPDAVNTFYPSHEWSLFLKCKYKYDSLSIFLPEFYFFCFVKLARTVLFILTFAFKNWINLLHKTWFILNIKVFFTNLGATSCLNLLEEILKHQWLILFTCKFDIYRQLYFKIIFLYWYLE